MKGPYDMDIKCVKINRARLFACIGYYHKSKVKLYFGKKDWDKKDRMSGKGRDQSMYSEAQTLKILMNIMIFLLIAIDVMFGRFLFNFRWYEWRRWFQKFGPVIPPVNTSTCDGIHATFYTSNAWHVKTFNNVIDFEDFPFFKQRWRWVLEDRERYYA